MLKQELLHQKAIFTKNRLEYMEKGKQIAMTLDYLSWPNQSLKLTNTFFKHKKCHRSTIAKLKSVKLKNILRKSPHRNRIYYISIKDNPNVTTSNTRSYSGMCIKSNHTIVMAKNLLKWKYSNMHEHRSHINYELLYDKDKHNQYKAETGKQLQKQPFPKKAFNNHGLQQQQWQQKTHLN